MPGALTILHVDMDAFYASVEQRDHPELRGKPVIVGGTQGRGVVCAASYEARPFGVRSAMPIVTARRLCPQAVFLPVRMSHYAEISRQIHEIFLSFTPLVEPLSLDEAFLDVAGCEHLFGAASEIAKQLREKIRRSTGLNASVGVAGNKFLAKLASDLCKPDGLLVLPGARVREVLDPLPVSRIWGVGAKGERRLKNLGIATIGALAAKSEDFMIEHFGEAGAHMWRLAHGIDGRHVVPDREANSVSTETTFAEDIGDLETLRGVLLDLVDHLATRLRRAGLSARTIEVKIRSTDFHTQLRSKSLADATNVTDTLWHAAKELFERSLAPGLLPARLLGVGASRLTRQETQLKLFEDETERRQKAVDQVMDSIRREFGRDSIRRGASATE